MIEDDLAPIVDQDETVPRVARRVVLTRQREDSPDFVVGTGAGEDFNLRTVDRRGQVHPLRRVESLRAVFREDDEVEPGEPPLRSPDHLSDLLAVLQDVLLRFTDGYLVVDYGNSNAVL